MYECTKIIEDLFASPRFVALVLRFDCENVAVIKFREGEVIGEVNYLWLPPDKVI